MTWKHVGSAHGSGNDESTPLLVDTDWMNERLDDPTVRIVDAGSPEGYAKAHIPGSVSLPDNYVKDADNANHVMPPDQFRQLMEQLGIADGTHVVVYDQHMSRYAGRLWWVLDYYGHTRCSIMDGGWLMWLEEARPVAFRPSTPAAAGLFTPRVNPDVLCTLDRLKTSLDSPDTMVMDVRSRAEHTGKDPRSNRRAGHIPGAIHLEWSDAMDPVTHRFRPLEEVREMYTRTGVAPDREVVTHCQAGIRAAHGAFTLRRLGFPRVRNYDASWDEWGNLDNTPVVQ